MNKKIKISIIGVTGYTGTELLRILLFHPDIKIVHLVSRQHKNTPLCDLFPRLSGVKNAQNLVIDNTSYDTVAKDSDLIFLCLPHMASQDIAPFFLGQCKIIDLSADFRLSDPEIFQQYYHEAHKCPSLLNGTFVYGLPEINKKAIKDADAVANPGCFALLVQTMLLPFTGKIKQADVIAISGTSGGGRAKRDPVDHPLCAQNIKSYLVNSHRHMPEIMSTLKITKHELNFMPSVGPFLRGIFGTAFVQANASIECTKGFFTDTPFVRQVDEVHLNHVLSTNYCDVHYEQGANGTILVQGAIDNLLRGASGTAVQNMNLMCGLPETAGLNFTSAIYP